MKVKDFTKLLLLLIPFVFILGACQFNTAAIDIRISNTAQFKQFIERLNAGETFEGKTIVLERDICLTDNEHHDGGPIPWLTTVPESQKDDSLAAFEGTFDGNEKTLICNISGPVSAEHCDHQTIFAKIGKSGVLKNLTIKGHLGPSYEEVSQIKCEELYEQQEHFILDSGIIYKNSGRITNCRVDATLIESAFVINNYGLMESCAVRGHIAKHYNCAGIATHNSQGSIIDCRVCGKVEEFNGISCASEVGGITSFNSGLIRDCNVQAEIRGSSEAGGFASTNNGLIENCKFEGEIYCYAAGSLVSSNYTIIKSCVSNAQIIGEEVAELASANTYGNPEGYTKEEDNWEGVKGQQLGVIQDCEFVGSVNAGKISGIAVVHNFPHYDGVREPSIVGCKINGVPVVRAVDR